MVLKNFCDIALENDVTQHMLIENVKLLCGFSPKQKFKLQITKINTLPFAEALKDPKLRALIFYFYIWKFCVFAISRIFFN